MPPQPLQQQNVAARTSLRGDESGQHYRSELAPGSTGSARNSFNHQSPANRSDRNGFNFAIEGRHDQQRHLGRDGTKIHDMNTNNRNARTQERNHSQNPSRQHGNTGLRARTDQLQSANMSSGLKNRSEDDDENNDRSRPSGQSATSNPSRGLGPPNKRGEGGFGSRGGSYGGMNSSGYGGMGGGYGGYGGGGMYGMGGMGMGMGMGMGSHMMMGPFSWIYSLNNLVHSIPMMMDILGMNSQMLYQIFNQTCAMLMKIVTIVRTSGFRRFLQQKSRRSKVLRLIFIFGSMGLASQALKLAKLIAEYHYNQRRRLR